MAYSKIEAVSAQRQHGNSGPEGWGFVMTGDSTANVDRHRSLLERLDAAHPELRVTLPEYETGEDYISGSAVCDGAPLTIYYENLLDYLEIWSEDCGAVTFFRTAVLCVAP